MPDKILTLFFTIILGFSYGNPATQSIDESRDHLPFSLVEFQTLPSITNPSPIKVHERWKLGVVPYLVDVHRYDTFLTNLIVDAMRVVEQDTCLRFKPLLASPLDGSYYLNITVPEQENNRGCYHEIEDGENGAMYLRIGYDCLMKRPNIMHSVLHAAGLRDEVNHPQRDKYIRIMWDNIKPEHRSKFRLNRDMGIQGQYEYDPYSVTHFHDRAFTRNGQATIVPLMPGLQIRPSNEPSLLDIQKLRAMYANECNKRKLSKLTHSCKHIMKGQSVDSPCAPHHKLKGDLIMWENATLKEPWANKTNLPIWTKLNVTNVLAWANITGSKPWANITNLIDWTNVTNFMAWANKTYGERYGINLPWANITNANAWANMMDSINWTNVTLVSKNENMYGLIDAYNPQKQITNSEENKLRRPTSLHRYKYFHQKNQTKSTKIRRMNNYEKYIVPNRKSLINRLGK